MPTINWSRVLAGGLLAAVIAFVTDGFLHERLLAQDWAAVYSTLGVAEPHHDAGGIVYFIVFELGRGMLAIILYAMMRARLGAGPKTATLAGILTWIAFSVTGPAQFVPLGFYSHALWMKVAAFQLVTSILAAIAGAALYKEAFTHPAS